MEAEVTHLPFKEVRRHPARTGDRLDLVKAGCNTNDMYRVREFEIVALRKRRMWIGLGLLAFYKHAKEHRSGRRSGCCFLSLTQNKEKGEVGKSLKLGRLLARPRRKRSRPSDSLSALPDCFAKPIKRTMWVSWALISERVGFNANLYFGNQPHVPLVRQGCSLQQQIVVNCKIDIRADVEVPKFITSVHGSHHKWRHCFEL